MPIYPYNSLAGKAYWAERMTLGGECTETERRRYWAMSLILKGETTKEAARQTGFSTQWVRELVRRYLTRGETLRDPWPRGGGRPRLLNTEQERELSDALRRPPPNGGHWTGRSVAQWIAQSLGRPVALQRGSEYMKRLGPPPRQLKIRSGSKVNKHKES